MVLRLHPALAGVVAVAGVEAEELGDDPKDPRVAPVGGARALGQAGESVQVADLAWSGRAREAGDKCFICLEFRCQPTNIAR